ncbi:MULTISPECIES: hypothetical protein [Halorussus]|uniref:hypothetical protein n=1 Tax=Halorussus TaxID=1070314 RepID=UPI00209ED735|nr:hypothetical protein [Halorussus vallis]USZ78583.1 hypothetical protein NGM07_24860 [Halorussus vallis]
MGFDDLEEAVGEQTESDDGSAQSTDSTAESESEPARTGSTPEKEKSEAEEPDPREEPAFPYDSNMQHAIYGRKESMDAWEDARDLDVKRILKREHGVKNAAKREIGDAVLRIAADRPELVAQYVLEARGLDVDRDE